jgi:hypothetical protein
MRYELFFDRDRKESRRWRRWGFPLKFAKGGK